MSRRNRKRSPSGTSYSGSGNGGPRPHGTGDSISGSTRHTVSTGALKAQSPIQHRSSLGLDALENIRKYVNLSSSSSLFDSVHRADLLPLFFKFHGEPYSLKDHVQMREFYARETAKDTLLLCGRQVGKSLNLSRQETLDCLTIPNLQVLYVAPLQQQSQRYSTLYLNEAIQSCDLARKLQDKSLEGVFSDSKIMTSVGHKSFANGAGIQLMYAKTSPDRARGIMADRIDFDEIQDQIIDNVPVISQSLKASKFGIRKFTGTAKTVDNTIERLWQQSSMAEWVMKCSHCRQWNVPNRDGNIEKMPQKDGMHCAFCGGKLNVREGTWVHFNEDKKDMSRGYHIPQVIVPFMEEQETNWSLIWRDICNLPPSIVMQEIYGISESAGERIITETDVKRQSTLPTMGIMRNNLDRYVMRVAAVDWGGAERVSFTVVTILGVRPDGRIDVLFAQRFSGIDPDVMFVQIAKAYNRYECAVMACDYGLGFHNNQIMQNRYGCRVVQLQFVRANQLLSFHTTGHGDARWSVDKTSAVRTMFYAIKYGRVYFPPYDEFEPYTRDLFSPYEHVADTSGISTVTYMRDPSRPDDFAMALTFGLMVAAKLSGMDMMDLIPHTAFNPRFAQGAPSGVLVDPNDFMAHE